MVHDQFVRLMQVALGKASRFDVSPSPQEWEALRELASRQGVSGIAFGGVERLPKEQRPPLEVLMDWVAVVDYMEGDNRRLNALCVKVCDFFRHEGLKACILKGQGLGVLYPQPLRRDSGDIDVWAAASKEEVERFVCDRFADAELGDGTHHASFAWEGVEVEVHYVPASLYAPWHSRRLQAYFADVAAAPWTETAVLGDGVGRIDVPSLEFDLVFVLVHLFHHWAFEGCGMKQVMDYYWLTEAAQGYGNAAEGYAAKGLDEVARRRVSERIGSMGLGSFLAAMMALFLRLGMEKEHLLCAPNERLGDVLLNDILTQGIVTADELVSGTYAAESKVRKFWRRFRRVLRVLPLAPAELLCALWRNVYVWLRYRH